MEASAEEALKELLAERARTIRKAWDGRANLGEGHWLTAWGKTIATDGLAERAQALAKTHERSKLAQQFKDVAFFLGEQNWYWTNPKGELNQYMKTLKEIIDKTKDPKAPFLDHAKFERELLHAVQYQVSRKYDEDTKLTSFYRYWKFAFDLPPKNQEPFVDYVNRLCREKLWDYCKPLMWEHRPHAINRPYMEHLEQALETFRKDYPDSALDEVAKAILEMYQGAVAEVPQFEEYPKLPDGRTARDAVGGDELIVGPRGIAWNGAEVTAATEGRPLGAGERAAAAAALDAKLKKVLEDIGVQYDEPTIELVVTQFDRTTPLAVLAPLFDVLREDKVTEVGIMARRRADGSNRKVGVYLATYWTPYPPTKDIEDRKTPEQRKADEEARIEHDPRRKLPETIAGMQCRAFGRTGKVMAETKQPTAYLAFTAKEALTGAIEAPESYVKETAKAAAPAERRQALEALADAAFLDGWAAGLTEPAVLAFHESWTYDELQRVLQRVLVTCKTETCEEPTEREDAQFTIALCR